MGRRCAGIPLEKRTEVTFHNLRHTAASLMVAEGVPRFDIAKILGHSTLAVTMRYGHLAPKAGRAGIDKLGKALGGATEVPSGDRCRPDTGVAEAITSYTGRRSA